MQLIISKYFKFAILLMGIMVLLQIVSPLIMGKSLEEIGKEQILHFDLESLMASVQPLDDEDDPFGEDDDFEDGI